MGLFDCAPIQLGDQVFTPQETCVDGRLRRVRSCDDAAVLREALEVPGLQATVRRAIEAKLRKLP